MKHPLADPNNHAPEPALDAEWDDGGEAGDLAGLPAGGRVRPLGQLRPRERRMREPEPERGVRIEPALKRLEAEDEGGFQVNRIGEVVRLESDEPAQGFLPERLEPSFVPAVPMARGGRRKVGQEWGVASGRVSRWWMMGAGVGVTGVIVAGLVLQSRLVGRDEAGRDGMRLTLERVEEPELPQGFDADPTAVGQAMDLLAAFAAASSVDEVVPLVRDGGRLRERLAAEWRPWGAPAGWRPDPASVWETDGTQEFDFGVLSGFRPDFERFRAYFVRQDGRMVVDWEATEARSDVPLEDLARGVGDGGRVRVWAKAGNFHTLEFPEEEFRAVQLLSPRQDRIIWGYAARGSAADLEFGKIFDGGLILESDAVTLPFTLRLVPTPSGSLPNQWEISEVLHAEWVQP